MNLSSLQDLLVDQLKDLYSAENQLIKALPKMAKNAATPALKETIENHLQETREQADRLQRIAGILNCKVSGKKCKAMEGLIEEGKEVLDADGEEAILDAAMVAAAQRVEHYEIAAYGSARTMAELLGLQEIVSLLQESLNEEKAADEKLTHVVEHEIYPQANGSEMAANSEGQGARR